MWGQVRLVGLVPWFHRIDSVVNVYLSLLSNEKLFSNSYPKQNETNLLTILWEHSFYIWQSTCTNYLNLSLFAELV